jgi:hypothetical protein
MRFTRSTTEFTLTEKIISVNSRLSDWRSFNPNRAIGRSTKSDANMAASIVGQLTHTEAVACVAADWHKFGSDLRVRIATLCNRERDQPSSNTKAKMIRLLDKQLGGKVLRSNDDNQRTDAAGRRYDEAKAAAQRKYANR